jgi:hypothetical protein
MEVVPWLSGKDTQTGCYGFPLYHPNKSTQNIFVDENLQITYTINWAFASSVPPTILLVCPGLPHPSDRVDCSDRRKPFADGFIAGQGFNGQTRLDFSPNDNDGFELFFRSA